jgi:uncharacterized protein
MRFYITEQLSEHISETPEGYLLCSNVPITRTGEFLYKGDELLGHDGKPIVEATSDGIVRIQRDEGNVFSDITIKSFEGKPFTLDHPKGFVGPDNWQDLSHGTVQNVRRGEGDQADLLLADILVTTEEAIEMIKSGQREISCGYDAEYEQIEKGIGRQTEIIGNHVALVSKGRAGSRCAIADQACTGCGACTCGKNKIDEQEDGMKLKDKFLKWLDSCPIKDGDGPDDKEAEEAKEEAKEEEQKPAEDKKTKDEDGGLEERIALVESKVDEILGLLKGLLEDDEEETPTSDKKAKDEDEDPEDKEDDNKESEDEDPEDKEDDNKESEDADGDDEEAKEKAEEKEKAEVEDAWPDLLYHAGILLPDLKIRKPTKDYKVTMDAIKADILDKASINNDYGAGVQRLLAGKSSFRHMTSDALDVALNAASEMVAKMNNSKIQRAKSADHGFPVARTVADINKMNKDFYGKK